MRRAREIKIPTASIKKLKAGEQAASRAAGAEGRQPGLTSIAEAIVAEAKTADSIVQSLVVIVTRLSLAHTRDISATMGVLCLTFLMEVDHYLDKPLPTENDDYFEVIKHAHCQFGPLYVWMLKEMIYHDDLRVELRQILKQYLDSDMVAGDTIQLCFNLSTKLKFIKEVPDAELKDLTWPALEPSLVEKVGEFLRESKAIKMISGVLVKEAEAVLASLM